MKKIVYLSALVILSSVIANAQDKPKKAPNQEKIEEVKIVEIREGDISIGTEAAPYDKGDQDPDQVYTAAGLQVMPEYPGGAEKLKEDVQKNIDPSDNAAPKGTIVKVYVSFIIEKDGSISNVKVARDPGYGFAIEALSAVKKLKKKWNPGIQNGNPVRVSYVLPVEIKVP